MPELEITRTVKDRVNLDIPDLVYTQEEIEARIEAQLISLYGADYDEDLEWEWRGQKPQAKDLHCPPLPEYWFETKFGKVATNGALVIVEGFPLPAEFEMSDRAWRVYDQPVINNIEAWLDKEVDSMIPHTGWVAPGFRCLLTIPGLSALQQEGKEDSPAYLVLAGKIMGMVMPCLPRNGDTSDLFKFNQSKVPS